MIILILLRFLVANIFRKTHRDFVREKLQEIRQNNVKVEKLIIAERNKLQATMNSNLKSCKRKKAF